MNKDSITKLAQNINARGAEQFLESDLQNHCRKVKAQSGPRLFRQLAAELESSIGDLKRQLEHGQDLMFRCGDEGIRINKDRDPFVKFQIQQGHNGERTGVYFSSPNAKPHSANDVTIAVPLVVAADDGVYFFFEDRRVTPEELAERIMELLFSHN